MPLCVKEVTSCYQVRKLSLFPASRCGLCYVPVNYVGYCSFPSKIFIELIQFFLQYFLINMLEGDNSVLLRSHI